MVLPPSIHPDTGKEYVWSNEPENMPVLDEEVLGVVMDANGVRHDGIDVVEVFRQRLEIHLDGCCCCTGAVARVGDNSADDVAPAKDAA